VIGEIPEQSVHASECRPIVEIPPGALDRDQIRVDQLLEVEGEGGSRDVERDGQGAGGHAGGTCAYEGAENPQAGFLRQGCKG
jgi:hypothetical protein